MSCFTLTLAWWTETMKLWTYEIRNGVVAMSLLIWFRTPEQICGRNLKKLTDSREFCSAVSRAHWWAQVRTQNASRIQTAQAVLKRLHRGWRTPQSMQSEAICVTLWQRTCYILSCSEALRKAELQRVEYLICLRIFQARPPFRL